jgi:crotonobetainyl-CoA:carnitine CoA-transferase CaiB-like acyl-CoA transferase
MAMLGILLELNPGLVVIRTTGFGQTGPYSALPGFGTLAEAMSGFSHINGSPDGPPTLPPFPLADGVAALTGAFAAMVALWWRDHAGNGRGQVIDLSIYEPLFWLLGPQALIFDQLNIVWGRTGNRVPFASLRNIYLTKDQRWVCISATTQSIAERVMKVVGRRDLLDEPWFTDHEGRLQHADELDRIVQEWIEQHTCEEALSRFAKYEAALAPVFSIEDIFQDPHYEARGTVAAIEHPILGSLRMPDVIPRLSLTPGRIRHTGPGLGEHNQEIFVNELGISRSELVELEEQGVI